MLTTASPDSEVVQEMEHEYVAQQLPLAGYAALMGFYITAFGGFIAYAKKRRGRLPSQIPLADILLIGIASHKLARVITEERVARPLRAPFVRFEGSGEPGAEVREKVRPRGFRRAVGELLTCPWCMAAWVAGGLTTAWLLSPRVARVITGLTTAFAISDWLNVCYYKVENEVVDAEKLSQPESPVSAKANQVDIL